MHPLGLGLGHPRSTSSGNAAQLKGRMRYSAPATCFCLPRTTVTPVSSHHLLPDLGKGVSSHWNPHHPGTSILRLVKGRLCAVTRDLGKEMKSVERRWGLKERSRKHPAGSGKRAHFSSCLFRSQRSFNTCLE